MPLRTEKARPALASLGIHTPQDCALWARKHGLLSVYLEPRPPTNFLPGAWQVIRPGYRTDPKTIAANMGRKTFVYSSNAEKGRAEDLARDWAAVTFHCDKWCRIEGLGTCLFPLAVAEELWLYCPELVVHDRRQKHKYTHKIGWYPSRSGLHG